ncbi:MAG: glycosyltransferase family 39 protein [Chthoniobacterales bacterium]
MKPNALTSRPPSALGLLLGVALARLLLHCATNGQYGFHRDELGVLDDARYLDWGYVSYPPLTPFVAHIALLLFGPSLVGLRFFAVLAQCVAMTFVGLITRELGGGRWAQVIAALAAAVAPMAVCMSTMFQYIAFDYLCWVSAAYFVIRLLRSENARCWLAIGAAIGLGMMTKYTMIFFVAGIVAGVLFTPARHYLKSPWLWAGAALSVAIFAPNIIWQVRHHWISLTFLDHIHTRDVDEGRADGFLLEQLFLSANLITLPLWIAGLYYYLVSSAGRRFRALGWMFVVPLALFLVTRGRFYYLTPAYPMLLAAGTVRWENWLTQTAPGTARWGSAATWLALTLGAAFSAIILMPLAPVNSAGWRLTSKIHDNFREQIGWPELAQTVAGIYDALPVAEKPHTAILAGNYGEAGAINLYGRAHNLPEVISGTNTSWWRGYGSQSPDVVILVGFSRASAERLADRVELAGHVANSFGVENEETKDHPDIFVCRSFKKPWPEFWKTFQRFG